MTPDTEVTLAAAQFALQLGIILIAARLGGEAFERWLHQPALLGELTAGVLIGPYALGGISWPVVGPMFPDPAGTGFPIPVPLWAFAQVAAVILLFATGLGTDFGTFVRFGPRAVVVAAGGVLVPFALGDIVTVGAGLAPDVLSPGALFVGAALTATSVGVTARTLRDLGRHATPEGVTILGAAVVDDVIGILVLGLVVAIASGGDVSIPSVGLSAARAVVIWVLVTAGLIVASGLIADIVGVFRSTRAALALALGLALICGAVMEAAGLATIIGAFSVGLALSRSSLQSDLEHEVEPIYDVTVPVFFVVVGMLVDVRSFLPVLAFGLVLSGVAAAGKFIGSGVSALAVGFRPIGAVRVGLGMVPRGEVALIIAGLGLASGFVDPSLFSVIVFMTFMTTFLAPAFLVAAFRREGIGYEPRSERPR